MEKTVIELVRQAIDLDTNGKTLLSKYVTTSMREDINTTEAYINSKHISGSVDSQGREKPFFNIVTSAVNIWYRATDIDRKNIKVIPTRAGDEIAAFLATIFLQEWMKKSEFATFLNFWGLTLARHGSAVPKFVEKDGQLFPQVMDWNNIIVDPVDFYNNLKIQKLEFTPSQLRKQKNYDQKIVKQLIEETEGRETIDGLKKDTRDNYIRVFEVHGELSLAQLKQAKGEDVQEGDEDVFIPQMHVISFKGTDQEGGYTLYAGREAKDPYQLTHLIEKDGQTYAGGAVKNLFEAQWMVNLSQKQIKDQIELASKIIFQTSDPSFVGANVLTNIENGQILTYQANQPLTQLNNKADIAAMQALQASWMAVSNQINGIAESMVSQAKSGTAWRQTQAELQEAHSLFELMTENKGNAVIKMLTDFVIPYIKKQLDTSDELSAILEEYQIKEIDSRYLPNEVIRRMNQKKKDVILNGEIFDPATEAATAEQLTQEIQSTLKGNQRFIKPSEIDGETWKDIFKDLEWKLDFDVTGESKDVQAVLATLTNVLTTIASNPLILQDENARLVFNKILSLSGGISPLEIQATKPAVQPPVPVTA